MPFAAPFRTYLSGDFFYGFVPTRQRLAQQLTNGRLLVQGRQTVNQTVSGAPNPVAMLDELLTDNATHVVATLNRDFAAFCRRSAKYRDVVDGNNDTDRNYAGLNAAEQNKQWRRKSKAGIEFLVTHGHNLHFAIDKDMEWDKVAQKPEGFTAELLPFTPEDGAIQQYKGVPDGEAAESKFRIITYAEIRFIFRNRNLPEFQRHVQFWYEGPGGTFEAGAPPWERTGSLQPWAIYELERGE